MQIARGKKEELAVNLRATGSARQRSGDQRRHTGQRDALRKEHYGTAVIMIRMPLVHPVVGRGAGR